MRNRTGFYYDVGPEEEIMLHAVDSGLAIPRSVVDDVHAHMWLCEVCKYGPPTGPNEGWSVESLIHEFFEMDDARRARDGSD